MNEHLSLDALSDVLAGEYSDHLDSCAVCRTEVDALRAAMSPVALALASLRDPEPPAWLADRLTAAVAAQRLNDPDPAVSVAQSAVAASTVTPLTPHRNRVRWLPVGAGLAAAAALVVGGVVLVNRGGDPPTTTASHPSYRSNSTGSDYRKDGTLLAAELPGLLAGTVTTDRVGAATKQASPVNGLAAPQPAGAASVDPLANLRATAGLAACLTALSDAKDPGLPLALDYATFEGQPALVVILPASKPRKVDVFVVGAACAQADAHLLFFTRLAKPS